MEKNQYNLIKYNKIIKISYILGGKINLVADAKQTKTQKQSVDG